MIDIKTVNKMIKNMDVIDLFDVRIKWYGVDGIYENIFFEIYLFNTCINIFNQRM